MKNTAKIIKLESNTDTVQACIREFLEDKKKKSISTWKNYKLWIAHFLVALTGKEIELINWEDILGITRGQVKTYQRNMLETNKPQTINNKMSAVKKLYKYLYNYNESVRTNIVDVATEVVRKKDIHGSTSLTIEEMQQLINFPLDTYRLKGKTQSLFFETLFKTAIRFNAVLNMTKNNLVMVKDSITQEVFPAIDIIDKGKQILKRIPQELYDSMIELQSESRDERIFCIAEKTVRKTLSDFCESKEIKRKITLHSIKKTSVEYIYALTNDLYKASKHANHEDPKTTMRYLGQGDSLSNQPTELFETKNTENNITELEALTREELIEMVKNTDKATLAKILRSRRESD